MKVLQRAVLALVAVAACWAGDWSAPVAATLRDGTALVTVRARLAGDCLVVELRPADGWHVYAMDNRLRAKEALKGRMSLGIEQDTEVFVSGALELAGDWYQSEPKDFSQPGLRWYSYGFDGISLLVAQVRRVAGDSAQVGVLAQACDSSRCVSVEAETEVIVQGEAGPGGRPEGLVRVRGS